MNQCADDDQQSILDITEDLRIREEPYRWNAMWREIRTCLTGLRKVQPDYELPHIPMDADGVYQPRNQSEVDQVLRWASLYHQKEVNLRNGGLPNRIDRAVLTDTIFDR
jgi:hypothetical protein